MSETTIVLNDYLRDNLKWALECIWLGYNVNLNTGDWVSELSWKLGTDQGRPNVTLQDAAKETLKKLTRLTEELDGYERELK